ncbi:hypothetical protein [Paenibacillus hunanensis]|uniref:Uncharacterized protein n=1 Tax=Paenibacillus hunanensis TaxID=539262 RepID=A0ABU1J0S1_9BACL|nr:hypothetical protein [Paenibacillus hunanensis]MDR6244999.1 hypothetical protein [Paenibacillus hunanensis]GGI95935.1 hypothetical protein GCM10008022_00510 [Paenibacillus hunanensis]
MDYALFLSTPLDQETLRTTVYNIVCQAVENEVTAYEEFSRISCKYFVLDIETEDIISLDFIRAEYNMHINAEIGIQLFGQSFEKGLDILFHVFGNMIKVFNPDLVLVENGTDQLFRKENDTVIVNTKLDQYQIKYLSNERITLLGLPCVHHKLLN